MRTVASAAGVHQTTVSLALRDHPRISKSTRNRIVRIARELGYRVNPLVAALSASRRRCGTGRRATLGYVSADPESQGGANALSLHGDLLEGVRRRAEELGYGVDHLWVGDPRLTPERFHCIAETRGIHGLVVAPLAEKTRALRIDWNRFAAVAYSYSLDEPDLHRVTPDFYHGMMELIRRARASGLKRVGLVLDENADNKTDHLWLAAFLAAQHVGSANLRVAPLRIAGWDVEKFIDWRRQERPDAVVGLRTMLDRIQAWQAMHHGTALPQLTLNAVENDSRAGNRVDRRAAGEVCVDMVVGMLHRNERGIPARAHNILVRMAWHEGREALAVHQ